MAPLRKYSVGILISFTALLFFIHISFRGKKIFYLRARDHRFFVILFTLDSTIRRVFHLVIS